MLSVIDMEKNLNLSYIFYIVVSFGLSSTSISRDIGIPISVADITIVILLLFSIISSQKITLNLLTLWVLVFFLHILIVNMVLYYNQSDFSASGFLTSYARIILNFFVVLLIPSLLRNFDPKLFCKAILLVIKFHCLLVIFDPLVEYPFYIEEGQFYFGKEVYVASLEFRGRGLFDEPSFFSAYIGIMSSLVLQYQSNSKEQVFSFVDLSIIFLALIASASFTGIAVGLLIILQLLFIERKRILDLKSIFGSLVMLIISIPILFTLVAGSFAFITDRMAGGIVGGSTISRLVGSTVFTMDIIEESPILGIGLGGANQTTFLEKGDEGFIFDALATTEGADFSLSQNAVTYWAALTAAGGVPGLLIFYLLILGYLIFDKRTFYIGMMIFFIGISKGGVFEVSLWFIIATAIGFKYLRPTPETVDK